MSDFDILLTAIMAMHYVQDTKLSFYRANYCTAHVFRPDSKLMTTHPAAPLLEIRQYHDDCKWTLIVGGTITGGTETSRMDAADLLDTITQFKIQQGI